MPTYEYKCTECNERFEVEQSIHDDALTSLPGAKHEHQLKKVFSPVGIAFKGDGFYRNDARSAGSSSGDSSNESAPTKVSKDDVAAASSGSSSNDTSTTKDSTKNSPKKKADSSASSSD